MCNAAPFAQMVDNNGQSRGDCGAGYRRREEGGRRQPIAGKINILALAAHGSNRHWCSRETRQSDQGTAIKKKRGGGAHQRRPSPDNPPEVDDCAVKHILNIVK